MRDESDLEVLYSEDVLDADILVASDDDFFDTENPPGDSVLMMRPGEYPGRGRRHAYKYCDYGDLLAPHRSWDECALAYDPTGGVAWCAALCGALLFSWGFQVISNLKSPSRCRPLEF
jgi:hypothetical protein